MADSWADSCGAWQIAVEYGRYLCARMADSYGAWKITVRQIAMGVWQIAVEHQCR